MLQGRWAEGDGKELRGNAEALQKRLAAPGEEEGKAARGVGSQNLGQEIQHITQGLPPSHPQGLSFRVEFVVFGVHLRPRTQPMGHNMSQGKLVWGHRGWEGYFFSNNQLSYQQGSMKTQGHRLR